METTKLDTVLMLLFLAPLLLTLISLLAAANVMIWKAVWEAWRDDGRRYIKRSYWDD